MNKLSHRDIKSAAIVHFWFNPKTKELKTFDRYESHYSNPPISLPKELQPVLNENFSSKSLDILQYIYSQGWVRGALNIGEELDLSYSFNSNENNVTHTLYKLPSQYLFVKYLVVSYGDDTDLSGEEAGTYGDYTIPVLEGEDALTAWKHRNDVRHREKVTAQLSGGDINWLLSPDGKFHSWRMNFNRDTGKHHGEFLRTKEAQTVFGPQVKELLAKTSPNDPPSDVAGFFMDHGWSKGANTAAGLLYLDPSPSIQITSLLKKLPHELLLAKTLSLAGYEIPILEGEDALSAWNRRKDIRHRKAPVTAERVRLIDIPEEEAMKISPINFNINKYCPMCKGKGVFAGKLCSCVTVDFPTEPEI